MVVQRHDLEALGQRVLELLHDVLDALNDGERGGRADLQDRRQHRALAVDVHNALLRRAAVTHVADITDEDGGAVDGLDRNVVEILDRADGVVQLDRVLLAAELDVADRDDEVLCGDGVGHVLRREAFRLQRLRIEVDLHLSDFAAVGIRNGGAGHGAERGAHEILRHVENLLLGLRR